MDILSNKIIEKSKTIHCPLDTIWWKWTTHEGLLTFFGASNSIEFKIGGCYEIYFLMDKPIGQRGGEGNKIISFLPQKMLSFTWNAPPQFPEIRNHSHKTWVVVNFNTLNKDKTVVSLYHLGWLKGENWEAVYNYFNTAWETVLSWLEKSCESYSE